MAVLIALTSASVAVARKPDLLRYLIPRRPALRRAFALGLVLLAAACWQSQLPADQRPVSVNTSLPAYCQPVGAFEAVTIGRVIDGDTVQLADQRKVRVIGLNAPERGERHAHEAAAFIQSLPAGGWLLQAGDDASDQYHRVLADLFTPDGQLLAEVLVRSGLAFAVYFPPNLRYAGCLMQAERDARNMARGVWSEPAFAPLQAADLSQAQGGFHRLQGTVQRVDDSRNAWWIQLDGDVVLQVSKANAAYFGDDPVLHWAGRRIEVTGWLIDRTGNGAQETRYSRWMMAVRHPASVVILSKP